MEKVEKDPVKNILSHFEPKLTSSADFLRRLNRNLEAIEAVKVELDLQRRRNRKAVVIAALSGFLTGCLCMMLLPYIKTAAATWLVAQSYTSLATTFINQFMIVAWAITGITSVIISLNTYDIAKSILGNRGTR